MTFAPINAEQAYLSPSIDIPKPESNPELFYEVINQRERETADIINLKENAVYNFDETLTNQQWPIPSNPQTFRDGFRKIFALSPLATGAISVIPHNIVDMLQTTDYWANVITDVPDFRQVPYASTNAISDQIEMKVDVTNITIINGGTSPNITGGYAVIEYVKT